MRPTNKIATILVILGALLIAGLFFYQKDNAVAPGISEMKPSQFNLSQSNTLPEKKESAIEVTKGVTESSPSKVQTLQAEDLRKWLIFVDILKSKNDNDPRLDRELKKLSPVLHEALYEKYDFLAAEDRGGKGLIVFLIARDLNSIEDFQFLKKIYQESPCLSLADCKTSGAVDPHHSGTDQTTLIYAQLTALYSIDKQLSEKPEILNEAAFRSGFIQVLAQAESYAVPIIQEKARAIRAKYGL